MDEYNRPIHYYNLNDLNDRPSIDARCVVTHYYNIIEPEGLPSIDSIDDEYPAIEFDDRPHQQHYHDPRPDSNSLQGRCEPGSFNYTPYRRQSTPYFDPIEMPGGHRHAREAYFPPIEFEERSPTDNMTDTRGLHETHDADQARHLRQQSPYIDPRVGLDKERHSAREAHLADIDTADPYVGLFGFDASGVEFEPIDIDAGYALRHQEREERRRRRRG